MKPLLPLILALPLLAACVEDSYVPDQADTSLGAQARECPPEAIGNESDRPDIPACL